MNPFLESVRIYFKAISSSNKSLWGMGHGTLHLWRPPGSFLLSEELHIFLCGRREHNQSHLVYVRPLEVHEAEVLPSPLPDTNISRSVSR